MDQVDTHNVLFVYNSLMRGMPREGFLSNDKAEFVCPATARGELYALGDFPALIINQRSATVQSPAKDKKAEAKPQHRDDTRVRGELFQIFDPVTFFHTLDVIEGYWPDQPERSLFVRELIPVETENGEVEAWVYILNLPANGLPRFEAP
jgi:gamma-glutamylcyclotransferase (GGCT)/AIG2-like uncharacterized protein YtfP